MYAEANRGVKELPGLLLKVVDLLAHVTKSVPHIVRVLKEDDKPGDFLESNVFEVVVVTLDLMGKIECHMMQNRWRKFLNSNVVKEAESELDALKQKVVSVKLTEETGALKNETIVLKNETVVLKKETALLKKQTGVLKKEILANSQPTLGPILPRPELAPYFVGRTAELGALNETVRRHGSAAITGYGGLGKTQLMTAFAAYLEHDGLVPGGVFWVKIDGSGSEVIESLASFVDKLSGSRLSESDRRNARTVVELLKQRLAKSTGRWLLCLDNAVRCLVPQGTADGSWSLRGQVDQHFGVESKKVRT